MSTGSNSIDSKVERAFEAYLVAAGVTLAIIKGQDMETAQSDRVVIWSKGGPEHPLFTGNRKIDVEISVRSQAFEDNDGDDTQVIHEANVATVFDFIHASDLATQLSAAIPSFTCFFVILQATSHEVDGQNFKDSIALTLYCCPSVIS